MRRETEEMKQQREQEKLRKAQEEAKPEWETWLKEYESKDLSNPSFTVKTFSTYKDWATDFKTHPHGGRKASEDEVSKYLYSYKNELQEWGLMPIHARNVLCTYADWGFPEFDDEGNRIWPPPDEK